MSQKVVSQKLYPLATIVDIVANTLLCPMIRYVSFAACMKNDMSIPYFFLYLSIRVLFFLVFKW